MDIASSLSFVPTKDYIFWEVTPLNIATKILSFEKKKFSSFFLFKFRAL